MAAMAASASSAWPRSRVSICSARSARDLGAKTRLTTVGEPRRPHCPTSSMPAAAAFQVTISVRAARSALATWPRRISFVPSSIVTSAGRRVESSCTPPSERRLARIVPAASSTASMAAT